MKELGNVKVVHPSLKKPVYLELAKVVVRDGMTFVSGYETTAQGEAKTEKGGAILHMLQHGPGVKVFKRECDKKYAEWHDAGEITL